MLGIRLSEDAEARLSAHARNAGRAKSVVAREWILERLERENVDSELRRQSELISASMTPEEIAWLERRTNEWLRMLDEEDGGYDWGPEGPPI
jgi:predicted transcriptional regulator